MDQAEHTSDPFIRIFVQLKLKIQHKQIIFPYIYKYDFVCVNLTIFSCKKSYACNITKEK